MVQIPNYQQRVTGLDVGGGGGLPAFDQTLARSVEGFGVSVSQLGDHLQKQAQQKSTFSAEQGFLQFQNQMKEQYAQQQAQMPVAGEGFHDNWLTVYDQKSKEWLASVPPDLQGQYAERLKTLSTDWSGTAAVDQINERNKWFQTSTKDSAASLELDIRRNGPVNFDQFRASGDTLINNSPLSPAEKATMLKDWHANAAIARVQSLADSDPQTAADELHAWLSQQPTAPAGGGGARGLNPDTAAAIDKAAASAGIPAATMRAYALIESSGDPGNGAGGKYQGLFQLSADEFAKGGGGNILNATDNARAAAVNLKSHIDEFQAKFGRPPAPFELYLMHQQGVGGAFAHLANPSGLAWQNMRGTGEGQAIASGKQTYKNRSGPAAADEWAHDAIWGNVPDDVKKQFPGGVDSMTSADFVSVWANKVQRFGGGTSYLADLTPAQIDKLSSAVQVSVNNQRTEDNRVATQGREDLVKYGEDLIHNTGDPTKPQLTDAWLQSNRDNLTPSDYKYFKAALSPDEGSIKTPPADMLKLDDLVQSDPKKALTELRDQFANRQITRGTYDQLTGKAQGIINGDEKRPFIADVRSYLKQSIAPDANAASNEYATALQQTFAFDTWASNNKDATLQDAQREANAIIAQRQAYRIQALRVTLPLPKFLDAPNRYVIGQEQLDAAKVRTAQAKLAGQLSEGEAADEAQKINAWTEVVSGPKVAGF